MLYDKKPVVYVNLFDDVSCSFFQARGGHLVSTRVTIRDRDQDLDHQKIGPDLLIATVSGV